FERILTEPKASLSEQYKALIQTEGLEIQFDKSAIRRIAEVAFHVNETTENIGARRLHTVMERLTDEISFDATDLASKQDGKPFKITAEYVDERLGKLAKDEDLSRYIL
ncbi:MAG: HslU--HslV peptidase ATPase subunit, partial [Pseudomonadales bacterium]|nr:HslU--HslV peptidase ATPase subunit [Pseudomonadales bacterium]